MKNNLIIRAAILHDVRAINEIVNEAIKNSCSNWAWTERSYDDAVKWFKEHDCDKYCIFVAELNNKVVGYSSLSIFRNKEGYWPVVENSVYVHKDYRGKKIGEKLLVATIERAKECDIRAISAWIDSDNKESVSLHKKHGFYVAGEMKNVGDKFGDMRSVTIMQLDF